MYEDKLIHFYENPFWKFKIIYMNTGHTLISTREIQMIFLPFNIMPDKSVPKPIYVLFRSASWLLPGKVVHMVKESFENHWIPVHLQLILFAAKSGQNSQADPLGYMVCLLYSLVFLSFVLLTTPHSPGDRVFVQLGISLTLYFHGVIFAN